MTAEAPRPTISIAAIVPVGPLSTAKSRLGETLDAEEREDLVGGMLDRTIAVVSALRASGDLSDALVISPDRELLGRAARDGIRTLRQRSRGLNAGLREARDDVLAADAEAIVILPIDLPFATEAAVRAIIDVVARRERVVVLVPDRHGTGTNALGLRPATVIETAFGPGSRAAHRASAAITGATYLELDGPLRVDLDTPDDLVFVNTAAPERVGDG